MRVAVVLLVVAGFVVAAPGAAATGRLEPVRNFAQLSLMSAGNALVWTSRAGTVMVADDRARVRHRFRTGAGCYAAGATRLGEALVGCDVEGDRTDSFILNTRTGRARGVELIGYPHGLGRRWIVSIDNPGQCYHCESVVYTNRLTGRTRRFDGMEDPEYALDRRRLHRPPGGIHTVAVDGDAWLESRRRRGRDRLWLRHGDARRLVAVCQPDCWGEYMARGRVAYVSGEFRGRQTLYDRDLETGATRSWRLPHTPHWHENLFRVNGTLLLLSEHWDHWRLWRAPVATG